MSLKPNDKVLNFPCYKFDNNIYIVSLSRKRIDQKIKNLYKNNQPTRNEIDSFFSSILDNRIWQISKEALPRLKTFITKLQEKSITISHKLLQFEKILLIEGKPGVGKSHFVNTLIKRYNNNIVYRFWIGNQDRDYQDRLKFPNFLHDLNVKLFNDQKDRKPEEILKKIKEEGKTFIIDGLDHIENYNQSELDCFINFINEAKEHSTVIVLSRPLVKNTDTTID
jgi:Cdc6-like AAA superfamily ATPase